MRHKPRFRNASLRGFAGRTCARPLSSTDSRERLPIAIHPRRSFLRYRPSASRSGRGVADQSLARLRTASHPHEPRQQKLARLVFPPPTQRLAASVQPPRVNWGGFPLAALLRSSSLSLAPAHSARCLEGGEKVCAFPPPKPRFGLQMQPRSGSQPSVRADTNENRAGLRRSCFSPRE